MRPENVIRNSEIRQLRLSGVGVREIARKLRISAGTVAGVCDRAGLCKPHPRCKRITKAPKQFSGGLIDDSGDVGDVGDLATLVEVIR